MRTHLLRFVFLSFFLPVAALQAQTLHPGADACRHTRLNYFGRLAAHPAARIKYPGDAGIDVTYYKLDLNITYTPNFLRGAVTVGLKSAADNLTRFFLDLSDAMQVDSVLAGGRKLTFSRQPDQLLIETPQPLAKGQGLAVTVYYKGIPGSTGLGSFAFATHGSQNQPVIWSLSEPYGARDWFPCKDSPADKADSSDVWITAPRTFVSVSNGRLERVLDNPDSTTRTYHWRNRYPIANYLISVAMSNYALYEQVYKPAQGDSMPVTHYIYPEALTENVRRTLGQTTNMLTFFSDYFGPYPFLKEKYGHAQFGWGGGMEHQTISSMGGFNTGIIAHELAHQWFGDKITCRTWEHIWLNEGFASYAEALYQEAIGGTPAYRAYMAAEMTDARRAKGSLYVRDLTDVDNIFDSYRTYSKGSVVVHMLRWVVGDQKFREILRTYMASPLAYGTATTEDFAAIASTVYGQSLDYFFKEWIYGENYPTYRATWSSSPAAGSAPYRVQVTISQTTGTANPAFFTMPLPIQVKTDAGDTLLTVFNDRQSQTFELAVKGRPTELVIDPENRILKQVQDVTQVVTGLNDPVAVTALTVTPNPVSDRLTLRIDAAQPFSGRLSLLNPAGQEVASLPEQSFTTGRHTVSWTVGQLAAGRYLVSLSTGDRRLTKAVILTK
ncbi:M1 family metallopeptidase [Larkinella soli]|uniref:M1 family metallopeptidase n=1 Tax=Larkinella soli TaxID=1770527 RepID=UPI000FFB72F7|nr:M1 family metallopeptidase [Larkinella soli]